MKYLLFIISIFILTSIVQSDIQKGIASYYGNSMHGRRTYSGEKYNKDSLTAAHRTLPMGTKVKVTNLKMIQLFLLKSMTEWGIQNVLSIYQWPRLSNSIS